MSKEREMPRSSRGRATREKLLAGARRAFETHGFVATRINHITDAAGVAYGSFYTHFDSKEAIFYQLAEQLFRSMFDAPESPVGDTPRARLEAANRSYWERYRANAAMMAIIEQVATIDPVFRDIRQAHRRATTDRMARSIRRWQERGLVTDALDADVAAQALTAMVDRTLYLRYVLGDDGASDPALATVNLLTTQALGLTD